jgi:hypothetical protein
VKRRQAPAHGFAALDLRDEVGKTPADGSATLDRPREACQPFAHGFATLVPLDGAFLVAI